MSRETAEATVDLNTIDLALETEAVYMGFGRGERFLPNTIPSRRSETGVNSIDT